MKRKGYVVMDFLMMRTVEKNIIYYGVYSTDTDTWDDGDALCAARKKYFETGKKQKYRNTVKSSSGIYSFFYSIEDGVILRYKTQRDGRPEERVVAALDGYFIETLDTSRRVMKRTYYNKHHFWTKTVYYSVLDRSVTRELYPSDDFDKPAVVCKTRAGMQILFPFAIPLDKQLTDKLNMVTGEPPVFCITNGGSYYFCTEEDCETRKKELQKILDEQDAAVVPMIMGENISRRSSFVLDADKLSGGHQPAFSLAESREVHISSDGGLSPHTETAPSVLPEAPAAEQKTDAIPEPQPEQPPHRLFEYETQAYMEVPDDETGSDSVSARLAAFDNDTTVTVPATSSASDEKTDDQKDSTSDEAPASAPKEEHSEPADTSATDTDSAEEAADNTADHVLAYERAELMPAVKQCSFSLECPYETTDKQIVHSGGRQYYYFGSLKNGKRSGRGRTVMKSGETAYEGSYVDGKRSGFGVYYYKTGKLCYCGTWKDNKRSGLGVAFSPSDGSAFIGEWENDTSVHIGASFDNKGRLLYAGNVDNGKKHGAGITYNSADGTIFVGKYKDGSFLGTGTQFDREGNLLYTGEYSNACRNGQGTEYRIDGTVQYKGEWLNNKYSGEGVLYAGDGGMLRGTFRRGKAHGTATLTDSSGKVIYEGGFVDDIYNGTGRIYSDDGSYAEGRFVDGEPTGIFNEYSADKKLVYCGEWSDMHRSGKGIAYQNGEKLYEGEFKNSLYCGEGKLYQDGELVYTGSFRDGSRNGFGVEYKMGEPVYKGLWKNDRYSGCGIIFDDGEVRFAGEFADGRMNGRINEVKNGRVVRKSVYKDGELTYMCEYAADGSLLYYGNVSDNQRNGMGCTFDESCEKQFEGIFKGNKPSKAMKVLLKDLPELSPCEQLKDTEYEIYRTCPQYLIENAVTVGDAKGIYSGRVKNGIPDGKGTVLFSDHRYTGYFTDGNPDGEGIIYNRDGKTYKGRIALVPFTGCQTLPFSEITYYYCAI